MFTPLGGNVYAIGYKVLLTGKAYISKFDFATLEQSPALDVLHECAEPGTYCYSILQPDSSIAAPTYYFPTGRIIVDTQQLENDTSWLSAFSIEEADVVHGIAAVTPKSIVLATDAGLFYTYSKYVLVNDIKKLTPNDVLDLFYSNTTSAD